jgi:ribosome-binding factor A
LPESAQALDTLLARVHELDAEVAKARENAKPVVEDAYKPARVVEDKFNN